MQSRGHVVEWHANESTSTLESMVILTCPRPSCTFGVMHLKGQVFTLYASLNLEPGRHFQGSSERAGRRSR